MKTYDVPVMVPLNPLAIKYSRSFRLSVTPWGPGLKYHTYIGKAVPWKGLHGDALWAELRRHAVKHTKYGFSTLEDVVKELASKARATGGVYGVVHGSISGTRQRRGREYSYMKTLTAPKRCFALAEAWGKTVSPIEEAPTAREIFERMGAVPSVIPLISLF